MPVSVFVTSGWRKHGVRETFIEALPEKKSVITVMLGGKLTKVFGMDWFRTYEDAEERAHALRVKEIMLFQKRIENLKSLPLCRGITISPRPKAKVVGLRAKQAKLLRIVAKLERDGITPILARISQAVGGAPTNTSRMLNVLIQRGMLMRNPDLSYSVTGQGLMLIPTVDK